jgi:glycosyl transferase family 1
MPTITYTGRLSDPRKGFDLFLDALELLWSITPAPAIHVWVIGGTAAETQRATLSALARPHVNQQLQQGRVTFWGRVDHASLPEFYSRSTVLVIPSFREQFGMVAVEAMMCGCAVVAAKVGGLQDIVVSGRTGILFERGNAAALAASLISYLNSPRLAHWQGRNGAFWAQRFDLRGVLPAFEAVLAGTEPAWRFDYGEKPEAAYVEQLIGDLTKIAEQLLGQPSAGYHDLTSSQSVSFRLDFDSGARVFVKQYSRRPRFLDTIHGPNASPHVHDPATYRLALMQRLQGKPFIPEVLQVDKTNGVIIQRWIDVTHDVDFPYSMQVASDLAEEIASTALVDEDDICTFLEAISPLASMDLSADVRRAFDVHAAQLQRGFHDDVVASRRMHPQIELLRITEFFERHHALLPPVYVVRAIAEMKRLLRRRLVIKRPHFAHGSFKTEHLLAARDRVYVCDFDHAGYYFGPMDIAHWLWDHWEHNPLAGRSYRLADLLEKYIKDPDDLYLAACWLLAFRLNKDLVFITRGEWDIIGKSMDTLWTFGDIVTRLGLLG